MISVIAEDTNTYLEQLRRRPQWDKTLKVSFIGDPGIDAGGLRRQYFTTLFKMDMFSQGSLNFKSEWLQDGTYSLLGNAVAYSILCGHPGPKCMDHEIVVSLLGDMSIPPKLRDDHLDHEAKAAILQVKIHILATMLQHILR